VLYSLNKTSSTPPNLARLLLGTSITRKPSYLEHLNLRFDTEVFLGT